jgi:pimeloyl-ACP methyl ester carboxylesterase
MQPRLGDERITFVEHGSGIPLVALHGVGVDHREMEAALEPIVPHAGFRRIYPDLPGMGHSSADGISSNNDVVAALSAFLGRIHAQPALLVGHSYGAYLARGLAAFRPEGVRGLALICPIGGSTSPPPPPPHGVIREDEDAFVELEPDQREGFAEYFVVRTRATARRYRDAVVPGTTLVDEPALERIFSSWNLNVDATTVRGSTLIVAGRADSTAGYADAARLVDRYAHASLAVMDGAGHALMHEKPELLGALLHGWIDQASEIVPGDGLTGPSMS